MIDVAHRALPANEVRPGDLVLGGKVLAVHRAAKAGVGGVIRIHTDNGAAEEWLPESCVMVLDQARDRAPWLPRAKDCPVCGAV